MNIKNVDYFWEFSYPFGEFLKKCFPDNYKRKFSLAGNGMFNLLYINDKIYEIKFTQTRTMLETDNKKFSDKNKEFILNTIAENLKNDYTINGGKYMTFKLGNWIAKVEVIKKMAEPQ